MTADSFDPWAAAGLDTTSGRLLEHLLAVPSADATALAHATGISSHQAAPALRRMEQALLVTRLDGQPVRWTARPPRASLGAILAVRRAELAAAESTLNRLQDVYEETAGPRATHLFEVLTHEQEVSARYTQLLKQSAVEVLHLAKPPYVTGQDTSPHGPAVREGVELRSVYQTDGFTDTASLETALRGTANGGQLRLAAHLPVKLVVFDRSIALLPVRSDRPGAGSVVIHAPGVVEGLTALFESTWASATPVSLESRDDWPKIGQDPTAGGDEPSPGQAGSGSAGDVTASDSRRIDERTREILRLMASGLKDDSIARALKISRRTVQKHISDAGTTLGAQTRFQLALRATEHGYLTPRPDTSN